MKKSKILIYADELRFDEETHTYWRGEKQLISVTQLLAKHGLAPDYSAVNEVTLKRKADRGSLIHKEIETYIKTGEMGFTSEFADYLRLMKELNLEPIFSEGIIGTNEIAGTYDLIAEHCELPYTCIIDFKTTAKLNKEAISWQLSLYAYLNNFLNINKFYAFHLLPNHRSKAVEIQPKSIEQIERLLECERNGEIYSEKLPELKLDKELAELFTCEQQLAELKRQEQAFEEVTEKIRLAILNAMEENGVKSFESDFLKITYVAPYEKEQVNTAKLRAEQPDLIRKYLKTSQVNASLRVKLKE